MLYSNGDFFIPIKMDTERSFGEPDGRSGSWRSRLRNVVGFVYGWASANSGRYYVALSL